MTDRKLLLSIHDVAPSHAARLERLFALAERHVGFGGYALLIVPDFHHQGRIDSDPAFAALIRRMVEAGAEPFLHGYHHLDTSQHVDGAAKMRARYMTAGEGEFLGLDHAGALQRLRDGRKLVEDMIGRPVSGFIAPAWLYSDAAREAVAAEGFALAEDHMRVWRPSDGAVLARGPVVTYATRTALRLASSLLWSRLAGPVLSGQSVLRIGLHPHDVDSPAILAEIDRLLGRVLRRRRVGRYAELDNLPTSAHLQSDLAA